MSEDRQHLVEIARRAAEAAGEVIREIYAAAFEIRTKPDASPVTDADERAERIILAALTKAAPTIPVIAEEEAASKGLPAQVPPRFWLVDPLDGTKEFVRRNAEFTVNIGLVEAGRAVLGIVHAPVQRVTYAAHGPGTATRQVEGGAPQPIATRAAPASGAVIVHSRSHIDEERLAAFIGALDAPQRRITGSAIKFCLVAAGEADFYPRFGTTMEWDTAAGQAILECAGGSVMALDGRPLAYGKPGFRNMGFIARGRAG